MWTSRSGQTIALSPHRVETLLAFARGKGNTRLLGVPLGHCGSCAVQAVAKRISLLARSARATGTVLANGGKRYTVFESSALGPRHRLLTRKGSDGHHHVIWLDSFPPSARPGSNLKELELEAEAEAEVSRRALKATLVWARDPLNANQVDRFARRDGVYIMFDIFDKKMRLLKVGLTTDPVSRFKAYKKHPGAQFFVATLRDPVTTKHPGQVLPTIEHAVANAIRRAALKSGARGLDPYVHKSPKNPFRATGRIEIGNVLPPAVRAAYPLSAALTATHTKGKGPRFDTLAVDPATPAGTLAIPRGKLFEAPVLAGSGTH